MTTVKKPPENDARPAAANAFALAPLAFASGAGDRRALLVVLVLASALFLPGLGALDLWAPDEPRYAAIAEELHSGRHGWRGLFLLHLNDAPYDQKPPLYFWLAAAFGLPFGRVDELAARLPSALAAIASVGLTFATARLLALPTASAGLAAALLATSFRFAFSARRVQLDVLLTALELAAIALFLLLERRRGGIEQAHRHPALIAALHGALGAAALVKGPVGWLPLLVFAGWLVWEGRGTAFRKLVPVWAWLLSLGPVLLWIGAATALAPDGFARDAVGTNVFARFFAGTSHARPFYYYLYQLPLDFLPWTLLWPFAVPALARACRKNGPAAGGPGAPGGTDGMDATDAPRGGRIERESARFLAAWSLVPLAFFTLSAGKRGLYLLPIFPALAIASCFALSFAPPVPAAGASAGPRIHPPRVRVLTLAIAAVALIELAGALLVLPRLDGEKSPRPIATAVARHSAPSAPVGLYRLQPLEGAIPYYGARSVASLEDEASARAFLAEAPRLILLSATDFEGLREPLALEPLERFRSGRRELVLARPRPHPRPPESGSDGAH